jgi:cyanophycinase-like exopeptidase
MSSDSKISPGLIVLFGSGETSPSGGKIIQALAPRLASSLRVRVLETPAGFELNSAQVAGRVADFMRVRLQNYQPDIEVIPARKRDTANSPDDPQLAARLHAADVIFLGPGSPTYAARQLHDSAVWHTTRVRHRLGAALIFASAATLAISARVLPVYEIYKAGEEPHWRDGLDLLGDFGLSLIFVPHWNNTDGGADLDTSHCFIGAERFARLRAQLPSNATVVGLDEHTALILDLAKERCAVMGVGSVTLSRNQVERRFTTEETFPLSELGPFQLPDSAANIPSEIWAQVNAPPPPRDEDTPSAAVLSLVEVRQSARTRKDWPTADAARQQLAALGWEVQDTTAGPKLRPLTPAR